MKTPMSSDTKLTKDEECESVDSTKYRGMIGTTHLGLWYPKGTSIETVVYADSDHAGDNVTERALAKAHIKPTSLHPMILSRILEKTEKVKSLASVIKKKLRFKIIKF
ncbi:hypothetical protein Tco_0353336 [Tanacetum coccineum]